MRISVPTIPYVSSTQTKLISPAAAVERVSSFLATGNTTLLTGAGVSVDSGIRAYRGKDGRYMNPNYRPIFVRAPSIPRFWDNVLGSLTNAQQYHEFVANDSKGHAFRHVTVSIDLFPLSRRHSHPSHKSRQRYWLRSYLGYPPVRDAQPNTTHYALAALQHTGHIDKIVTQNVDGLHRKAIAHLWHDTLIGKRILELHGTLHRVHCQFGHVVSRDVFQERLSASNPKWKAFVDDLEATGKKPRTNPDGDVELENASYDDFVVPECQECLAQGQHNTNQKSAVIFFGESIPHIVKTRSFDDIEQSDKLLLIGTTLATYSAYRLVKHALELGKPVLLLNVGPTRVDGLSGVDKVEIATSRVMHDIVRAVLGHRASIDPIIKNLLNNGIHKPPLDDSNR